MKKKIIIIAILGMFLLAGNTAISIAETTETTTSLNIKSSDPKPHLKVWLPHEPKWTIYKPVCNLSCDIVIENDGDEDSLLKWEITSWPEWGEWLFMPSTNGELQGGFVTWVIISISPPDQVGIYPGEIEIVNTEDPSNNVTISVELTIMKSRSKYLMNPFIQQFIEKLFERFPKLELFL